MPNPRGDSMTVIVHGRLSNGARWYRPGSDFHDYVRSHGFADVYRDKDYFEWSGQASEAAIRRAARDLVDWCHHHPVHRLRILAHSLGACVVNVAMTIGDDLQACTVIYLAPRVRADCLPVLDLVTSQRFFTVHACEDEVIEPGPQNFQALDPAWSAYETIVPCGRSGHWAPTWPSRWKKHGVARQVTVVCADRRLGRRRKRRPTKRTKRGGK
jgi:pimeloyl-ACP methyl ester carboxylesterase